MKISDWKEWAPFMEAVADRLIPGDAWPSATEEDVQAYLESRFHEDTNTWKVLLIPGLRALEEEAFSCYQRSFIALSDEEKDDLLQKAEQDQMQHWPVSSTQFFQTMLSYVAEGYYGNFKGEKQLRKSWEMIGFRANGVTNQVNLVQERELPVRTIEELQETYDAVIVGTGAGGSVAAGVLAESGLRVLIVERGSWLTYNEIPNDHLRNHRLSKYGHNTGPSLDGHPRTFLSDDGKERATVPYEADYHNNAMTVGGGTRVYGAQAWRFLPDDFRMATRYGVPEGSTLSDWPIQYEDLEPYYDRAEWEVGVSGDGQAHSKHGPRSRPFPMPPLPQTLEAERLAQGAAKLGWETGSVPLLINSSEWDGRPACIRCGQCVGFACPTDSKNGGHNTMLVRALATGNCDLIVDTMVERIETEAGKHATGVHIVQEKDGKLQRRFIRAGHVVVAAGAIESARLFLLSASDAEPDGIGNRTGQVGRNLQGHVYSGAYGIFDEPIQDCLGPGVSIATFHFAHGNDNGIIGGGFLANEFTRLPIVHWYRALAPDAKRWGLAGKETMRETFLRTSQIQGPIQEIPTGDSRVRLSPTVKDRFGLPVVQLSGKVHPESVRAATFLGGKAEEWLWASGARHVWRTTPNSGLSGGQHQSGTLRMGNDPATSVTDPLGRVHGYDNLWVCDGSLHVTNGGVNPVLTILALAFRTAENLVKLG